MSWRSSSHCFVPHSIAKTKGEGLVLESSSGTQHPWQNNQWNDERSWFWGTLHQSFTMCDFCYPTVRCRGRQTADNDENRPLQHWRCTCLQEDIRQTQTTHFRCAQQWKTEAKPEPAPEPKCPRHEEKENVMVPTFQITEAQTSPSTLIPILLDWISSVEYTICVCNIPLLSQVEITICRLAD